ncbi:MAG: nickel transporter permease NikC [Methanosaeta sp. PtaB.Bin018]|jgi:peptide/nickel transport system permease protein|nr:ABC transporter permease subunit [Methanothrix sp.]OPX75036.1 MAG: nickel transporter permease NikC [Methanosaeta sp. PtaB.Bin018]HOV51624.1 ABC transporter permease subunit [Methanothrix sp.]
MKLSTDRGCKLAILIIACLVLGALLAGWIAPHDPEKAMPELRLKSPDWEYPLGTDHLGRCIFSRMIFGIRMSLLIGVGVVLFSAILGIFLGGTAGYFGGILDETIMRVVDAFLAFPSIFLALAVIGFLGSGLTNMMLSLILVEWTGYARLVRSIILSLKGGEFLEAAMSLGASDQYILRKHLLPNVMPQVLVMATLGVGYAILGAASLSFLGLGVQPPTPEWGSMMNDARPFVRAEPQMMIFPGIAITITVLAFNLLGEGLRERLDPRSNIKMDL